MKRLRLAVRPIRRAIRIRQPRLPNRSSKVPTGRFISAGDALQRDACLTEVTQHIMTLEPTKELPYLVSNHP